MKQVRNLKMAKQKLDELEDFDDVCESMYFEPDQGKYFRYTRKSSPLVKRFPGMTFGCPLPILLTDQQTKRVALLLACKSSSLCVVPSSVISLSSS